MDIASIFIQSAERYPNHTALIFEDRRWTYREWYGRVRRFAQGLALESIRETARGQPDLRDAAEHERSSRSLQDRKTGMAHAFGQHIFGEERRPPAQVRFRHLAPDRRARLPCVGFALELDESHRLDSTGR